MKNSKHNKLAYGLADFLLLNVAFGVIQLAKRGDLVLSQTYILLFLVFYLAWTIAAMVIRKFDFLFRAGLQGSIQVIIKSNIIIIYIVSFATVLWAPLARVSRMQTFGVCCAFLVLEIICFCAVYVLVGGKLNLKRASGARRQFLSKTTYFPLIYIDAVLLIGIFFGLNYLKRGTWVLPARYEYVIVLLYALWFVASFALNKFDKRNFDTTYTTAITPCIKATVLMGASLAVTIFSLRLFYFSRLQLYGTIAGLMGFELVVYFLYYFYRKRGRMEQDIETVEQIRQVFEPVTDCPELPPEPCEDDVCDPVEIKLKHALEFFNHSLYDFVLKNIDLSLIDRDRTAVLSTEALHDIQCLADGDLRLLINLHKTNDIRWFNRYFLSVYHKLKANGYFVGNVRTIETRKSYYRSKYSGIVTWFLNLASFVWLRVFPKLPITKKIYFTITRGRKRMVSKAEIFGRLHFCGFRVIDEFEISNTLFFIAQKVKEPSRNQNPTYGPLVKLRRSGYSGQMITVYKFRTMYPYSEFLQEYIYKNNSLDSGGKFKDDFRITDWGKYARALWIDELPMLYNWLKGDMKFFGVRPLSSHYLSLYTNELKELRKKVIPGLVPPFYADLPETLNEIIDSELRYIKSYLKAPVRTQFSYLWHSYINIVIKGARSR